MIHVTAHSTNKRFPIHVITQLGVRLVGWGVAGGLSFDNIMVKVVGHGYPAALVTSSNHFRDKQRMGVGFDLVYYLTEHPAATLLLDDWHPFLKDPVTDIIELIGIASRIKAQCTNNGTRSVFGKYRNGKQAMFLDTVMAVIILVHAQGN